MEKSAADITAGIENAALRDILTRIISVNKERRAEHEAAGGTVCPRCHAWLTAGQVCRCKPAAPPASSLIGEQPPPELAEFDAKQKRRELIMSALRRRPTLTLKDVQRKLKDATWSEFSTARTELTERLRKEAWRIMDTLPAGAPLPRDLRRLCEELAAVFNGITFELCGEYVVRRALRPKLAEAYYSDKACPWTK